MQNTELLLKKLTLEEKCALLSGAETFKTRGMPEHGIPQIWLSDGPHGLRKQAGESDHLGLNPQCSRHLLPHGVGCCEQLGCRAGRGNRRSLGRGSCCAGSVGGVGTGA